MDAFFVLLFLIRPPGQRLASLASLGCGRRLASDPSTSAEDASALYAELAAELAILEKEVGDYEVTALLSGPYDRGAALLPLPVLHILGGIRVVPSPALCV